MTEIRGKNEEEMKESEAEPSKPCMNWNKVTAENAELRKFDAQVWELGDHNYCRNPGFMKEREFCFTSTSEWHYCATRTCGMLEHKRIVND